MLADQLRSVLVRVASAPMVVNSGDRRHTAAVIAPWRVPAYPVRPVDRRPRAARHAGHGLMSHMNTIQRDDIPMILSHAVRRTTHEPGGPAGRVREAPLTHTLRTYAG